jgi:hypothetical protein
MRLLYALLLIYAVVLSAVAVASAAAAKRLTPAQLNRWLPGMRLANLILVCAFIIVVAIYVRVWLLALPVAFALLFYPTVRHVRACESCGKVVEPLGWRPATSCPRCGASLSAGPARLPNNRWSGP